MGHRLTEYAAANDDIQAVLDFHGLDINEDLVVINDKPKKEEKRNQAFYDNLSNAELAKYGNAEQWAIRFQKIFGGMQ